MYFSRQRQKHRVHSRGIAQNLRGSDGEPLSGPQQNWRAASQGPGANLWSLQVSQDCQRLVELVCNGTQVPDAGQMLGVAAVRKIQTRHIHARLQQAPQHARMARSGTDRTYNFGVAKIHANDAATILPLAPWPRTDIFFLEGINASNPL